jgi:hypothetical protein
MGLMRFAVVRAKSAYPPIRIPTVWPQRHWKIIL